MPDKKLSNKDKLAYYFKRVDNQKLTPGQRAYAKNFINNHIYKTTELDPDWNPDKMRKYEYKIYR